MKSLFARTAWSVLLLSSAACQAAQFKFPTQTLTVPDGLEVELIAGPPLVDRPISASFDERGRLYVTDSSGSNDKVDKQLAEKPHRVVRLEDTDGDGRFDKNSVFADHLMFPEGCLWFNGSLYVSAPPSIWKLTDTNDDGVAEQRAEWHEGKTLTGCANDLHGPYLGPDGWIYWCKGAFAKQTYELPGRKPFSTRAAHIFRAPPDHSDLESVLTAGMDNPVGVAFTPGGERIMCGTFLVHPEAGRRDGIVHAIYGGVYGKPHDVLDGHKKTGDLMPIMIHLGGAAAPCSVIRYESDILGLEYQDNLFVCCFNMHKITRHVLQPQGATFQSKDSDFLVSDNTDFHPTDVLEDADGSLIILDTGGWYKLCCPTSQLSKPDVLGAIYRVRRTGAKKVPDPRGLTLAWESMSLEQQVKLLDDSRPAVRKRAIHELSKRGPSAVSAIAKTLKATNSAEARRNAVWTLTRIDAPGAREAVRAALKDGEPTVVQAAIHSVSLWREASAKDQLTAILRTGNAPLERAAAEALGRIGNKSVVPALLACSAQPCDRALEHSLIYALIEIADAAGTLRGAETSNAHQQRVALIALDQMDYGGLTPELISPLLAASDALLRQTAVWIIGHHPDWGDALAGFFRQRLDAANDLSPTEADELKQQIAQFASASAIQQIIAAQAADSQVSARTRQLLLQAMALSSVKDVPADWGRAVEVCLAETEPKLLSSAVAAARVLGLAKTNAPNFTKTLLRLAHQSQYPAELRLDSLVALPGRLPALDADLFTLACANLDPSNPVPLRGAAASSLARARLTDEQLMALTDGLKDVGPLEMTKLLEAFEHSSNAEVGAKLVAALKNCKGRGSLRWDVCKNLLTNYPPVVQQQAQPLLASLNQDAAKQKAHLDELLASLNNGDVRRGQALFNSQKAACSACHAMGYLGGRVGPDLTSIGQARTERDLLEAIVYPSASFVRSYEPVVIKTKDDEDYSGVLRKDAPDEVVIATGPYSEARIARSEIVEMRPGTVSVMPAGLDEQLTRQELADLLAFLKATKWGAN